MTLRFTALRSDGTGCNFRMPHLTYEEAAAALLAWTAEYVSPGTWIVSGIHE
jgi:hypothetical protein